MYRKYILSNLKRSLLGLYFRYKRGFNLAEPAANPYATHIPVLVGLSRLVTATNILELGCGLYSTSLFLDRRVFPNVVMVRSLENDEHWAHEIKQINATNPRLDLVQISEPVGRVLKTEPLTDYELIFIDDSVDVVDRASTIGAICAKAPQKAVVVIHDFEQYPYREAARGFRNQYHFTAFNPNTGVVWNHKTVLSYAGLREVQRLVMHHSGQIAPEDVSSWLEVMNGSCNW